MPPPPTPIPQPPGPVAYVTALVAAAFVVGVAVGQGGFPATYAQSPAPQDNPELLKMYSEDQSDRRDAEKIGWEKISQRDEARKARATELYRADALKTGADYYHAAMILQHGGEPEDYLLAHELCVVAIGKGEERGRWLAAASEDRFLMSLRRPQRFATQYAPDPPGTDGPIKLYKVDEGVTDGLRREFKTPTLAEARAREAQFNKK
jgi:hypothetical protein